MGNSICTLLKISECAGRGRESWRVLNPNTTSEERKFVTENCRSQRGGSRLPIEVLLLPRSFDIDPEIRGMCAFPATQPTSVLTTENVRAACHPRLPYSQHIGSPRRCWPFGPRGKLMVYCSNPLINPRARATEREDSGETQHRGRPVGSCLTSNRLVLPTCSIKISYIRCYHLVTLLWRRNYESERMLWQEQGF